MTEMKAPGRAAMTTCPSRTSRPHSAGREGAGPTAPRWARGEINVDWGMGEHLAFASLVASGYAVRLSGEDCGRGTFTHRHAVLHDQNRERGTEGTYTPLQNVADGQAPFTVIDSAAVRRGGAGLRVRLFAAAEPNTLTIWEAQFGDFVNGAQVVIDQFIASGEVKWGRASTAWSMMLPHGYEGQGPEHSSAALSASCSCAPTTTCRSCSRPRRSQIFHVLRRQMVRMFRKPLVIMTPKSLLRNQGCEARRWIGLHQGRVQDRDRRGQNAEIAADKVKRVIVCSGKVYYDLVQDSRNENKKTRRGDRARGAALSRSRTRHSGPRSRSTRTLIDVVWCQDEPQNQGAWFFVQHYIHENMVDGQRLGYAGRAGQRHRLRPAATPTCTRTSRRLCWTRRSPSSRASS